MYALKSTYKQTVESFLIFQIPDLDLDLLRIILETLLKKLSSEIAIFCFFQRQFLQLCFKFASEQIPSHDLVFEISKNIQNINQK